MAGSPSARVRNALAAFSKSAPESQTMIVLSSDPDTILVPSGENATDRKVLLWASVFYLISSSVPARRASRVSFGQGRAILSSRRT